MNRTEEAVLARAMQDNSDLRMQLAALTKENAEQRAHLDTHHKFFVLYDGARDRVLPLLLSVLPDNPDAAELAELLLKLAAERRAIAVGEA
jgi:hypothetical protein